MVARMPSVFCSGICSSRDDQHSCILWDDTLVPIAVRKASTSLVTLGHHLLPLHGPTLSLGHLCHLLQCTGICFYPLLALTELRVLPYPITDVQCWRHARGQVGGSKAKDQCQMDNSWHARHQLAFSLPLVSGHSRCQKSNWSSV